jgi:4-hydroxybenzoate polyprenyltransferase
MASPAAEPTAKPVDALARHWTDALPAGVQPYARLARWDRPVGWQLLVLPCWMGIGIARTIGGFWPGDATLALLFLIGAIAMRGAGCTYNDILDRKIDAQVARTRARPIPAGLVSVRRAIVFVAAQCSVGLLVLLALPMTGKIAAIAAIPLVAAYPLMKRITWWPQAWLGLCFAWGALVAGASIEGAISPAILFLFIGCVAWIIGYDTIYALQDVEDDSLVGVRSTARLFGEKWRSWTLRFYCVAFVFWGAAASAAGAGLPSALALGALAFAIAVPLVDGVDAQSPGSALAAFKANVGLGLMIAGAFALVPLATTIAPHVRGN